MATQTTVLGLTKPAASENVSIASLNNNMDIIDATYAYATITDFNTFAPTGTKTKRVYGQCSGGTASNGPFLASNGDNATFRGYAEGVPNYYTQHFTVEYSNTVANRGRTFIRTYTNGTFGKWMELQNTYPSITVAKNGGTTTFTLALYGQCIVTVIGYADSAIGMFLVVRSSSSSLIAKSLGTAPSSIDFAMNSSTGVVTLTNNNASDVNVRIERFGGTLTV